MVKFLYIGAVFRKDSLPLFSVLLRADCRRGSFQMVSVDFCQILYVVRFTGKDHKMPSVNLFSSFFDLLELFTRMS